MRRIPFFAPLVTMTLATGAAFGQATSGDLVGTVKDATGAAIPNAQITVRNEATGVVTPTVANSSGDYRVSNLLPGIYDITSSVSGFQNFDLKGVRISLNSTSTANIALSVGSAQTVEVAANSGAVLDTTSENLTTSFSQQELSTLPTTSTGLGVINASLLSPGVASGGGLGIGIGPSVGGQRPRNNNFEVEGIDNNNKGVTGPLVYVPNDAVESFTLITNQFSPDFGHSSGGQFNTNILTGTNQFHGALYEYFQNRNLNAASGIAGGKQANPRYDNNRYGGQLGGPILRDKLFFFANFERNTIGQNTNYFLCTPTSAGRALLNQPSNGFSATNLAEYLQYVPTPNFNGGAQVTAANDEACFNSASGPQTLTVTNAAGANVLIPLGNFQVNSPYFSNFDALTTSADYNLSTKDQFRFRYIYNTQGSEDVAAAIPVFFLTNPFRYHLGTLSEYHTFTPNLTNEVRIGYNRFYNITTAGNFTYPGLNAFPNIQIDGDQDFLNIGPDGNAPQSTVQNLYQFQDNISYVKGRHTIKIGFDGRKYISPSQFTQRARGDYEYSELDFFLHDLAPDDFGERSSGNSTYYGDQTALYGYGNDTWRITDKLTLNYGLRYEFTSVPVGERTQALNGVASVPGFINFHAPQPAYKSFAPRVGIEFAPDSKTSIRAGFGIAYDVLFDNLGELSFPPELSQTQDVGTGAAPAALSPNFLANGGLPSGGPVIFPNTAAGMALARSKTSALTPDQVVPYAETYTLTVQHTFGNYTAEVGYVGTRGIHLPTQDQINIQPRVTAQNQLFTQINGATLEAAGPGAKSLGSIQALSNITAPFLANGFTSKITSYQPYSSSNYNGLVTNLTRRFQNGLQMNFSYTYSRTMDDATDEVFATVLTPRREQNSQNIAGDYSRSGLDRTHRATLELVYDLPYGKKSSNFIVKNLVGNWEIAPIYTYESPEYATVLSGVNSNLNGDSGAAIDRTIINPFGVKGTGSGVTPLYSANLAGLCGAGLTHCANNTVGYTATNPNAYYIEAGPGTLPTSQRNTLPIRPIDNFDVSAYKRLTFFDHYSFEFGAQAFNVLNHAQYIPGSVDNVNNVGYTTSYAFQTATNNAAFNQPQKEFLNNARTMQLSAKIKF